jgi:LAO/AO transport system kinase
VETVAKDEEGIEDVLGVLADHREYLVTSGEQKRRRRARYAEEIRTLVQEDVSELVAEEIERQGGLEEFVEEVMARERDPYEVTDVLLDPIQECVQTRHDTE